MLALDALVAPSALGVFLAGQLSRASRCHLAFFLSCLHRCFYCCFGLRCILLTGVRISCTADNLQLEKHVLFCFTHPKIIRDVIVSWSMNNMNGILVHI